MPPGLPKPPIPRFPPNPIKPLKDLIHEGVNQVHKAEDDIRSLTSEMRVGKTDEQSELKPRRPGVMPASVERAPESENGTIYSEETVSEEQTFRYQLERIIDDLQHLETEHLPAKGRIAGLPCDCIAKASRDLRRHSLETIPIASRQGKDSTVFSEMVPLANHLMDIGTSDSVKSGRYDDEYLKLAGIVSGYRKKIDKILTECKTCSDMQELATFIERRRQQSTKAKP